MKKKILLNVIPISRMLVSSVLVSSVLVTSTLSGFAQTNFFRPTDQELRLNYIKSINYTLGARAEYGSRSSGKSWDDKRANVLALQDPKQSAIDMIIKPVGDIPDSLKLVRAQLLVHERGEPTETRGQQLFTGDFTELDVTLFGSYKFPFDIPGKLAINAYLPIVYKKVDGFKMTDLTLNSKDTGIGKDNLTKELLTKNLKTLVKEWGNLDLSNWDQTGVGDLVVTLNWSDVYKPEKNDAFKYKLIFNVYAGVSCPTGKEKDEDKALSMPLGYGDGAWGIPFGLGLWAKFPHHIQVGVNGDFMYLFDKTRIRRLLSYSEQTEFLLLNKGNATKSYGFTWQFNPFIGLHHFWKGLSAKVAYQYVGHDDDELSPKDSNFNYVTVNYANNLKEWSSHNMIFSASYDFLTEFKSITPQVQLFYKLPVDGKNVIDMHTFGGQLVVNF
ncbi:MAG: hypothetical protein ABH827_05780 [bacterium]